MLWQAVGNSCPGLSKIGRFENIRIAIVHQMKVNTDVGRARIKMRGFDARNCAPGRQIFDVFRDVGPIRSSVPGEPNQPVVRARPNETLLNFRRRNRKYHLAIKLSDVVADQPSGRNDAAGILCRKIRADHRPALSAVGRFENDLAAVVHGVVIEWIDCQRRSPMTAILQLVRRRIKRVNPWTHGARSLGSGVPASHFVAVATGPDNVRIRWVRKGKSRFATSHSPIPPGVNDAAIFERGGYARAAHVWSVLHVAIHVVKDLVIYGDVIHMSDGELHTVESAPVQRRHIYTAVACDDNPIAFARINPDIQLPPSPRPLPNPSSP